MNTPALQNAYRTLIDKYPEAQQDAQEMLVTANRIIQSLWQELKEQQETRN